MKQQTADSMLTTDRIIFFSHEEKGQRITVNKDEVIRSLCQAITRGWESVSAEDLTRAVLKREASLPTRLGPLLAVPHAVITDETKNRIAAAVIPGGVRWDNDRKNPVRLVFLLAGGRVNHLHVLSELAGRLRNDDFQQKLLSSDSPEGFLSVFTREAEKGKEHRYYQGRDLSAEVFREAVRLRNSLGKSKLILHVDDLKDSRYIGDLIAGEEVVLVTAREGLVSDSLPEKCTPVVLPFKGDRRSPDIRFSLLYLLGLGILHRGDMAVNVFGFPHSGFFDSIRLVLLGGEMEVNAPEEVFSGFPRDVDLSVFNRVVHIALELASEGREGKPVGTIFVLGDQDGVLPYTTRMIANPFHGYPREDRNILDPGMEETVKEYAKIDGAFIISGDGTIESAGIFLSGRPSAEELQSGLGARHAAAQGITAVSSALAVVISESTRKVTVFQSGKKIMDL